MRRCPLRMANLMQSSPKMHKTKALLSLMRMMTSLWSPQPPNKAKGHTTPSPWVRCQKERIRLICPPEEEFSSVPSGIGIGHVSTFLNYRYIRRWKNILNLDILLKGGRRHFHVPAPSPNFSQIGHSRVPRDCTDPYSVATNPYSISIQDWNHNCRRW